VAHLVADARAQRRRIARTEYDADPEAARRRREEERRAEQLEPRRVDGDGHVAAAVDPLEWETPPARSAAPAAHLECKTPAAAGGRQARGGAGGGERQDAGAKRHAAAP